MLLKADALPGHLQTRQKSGTLAPIYVIAGDEPLLAIEAADAIRAAARAFGYSEREVLHADARFDWSRLTQAATGLSLFSEKRIVELRLPAGKPGKSGGEALRGFAEDPPQDLLVLISRRGWTATPAAAAGRWRSSTPPSGSTASASTARRCRNGPDDFTSSTLNPATMAPPTPTSTSYAILSDKGTGSSSIAPNDFKVAMNSTSTGRIGAQARFATTPLTLATTGDYVELSLTFNNTLNLLTVGNNSYLGIGLFDSGGADPVAGGVLAMLIQFWD